MNKIRYLAVLLGTLLLSSCDAPDAQKEGYSHFQGNQPSRLISGLDTCLPTDISYNGKTYKIGRDIGHGQTGFVTTLIKQNGQESNSLVLKLITNKDIDYVYTDATEESYLAQLLGPKYFVKTDFHYFRGASTGSGLVYVAALVKKRVRGHTLSDILDPSSEARALIDTPKKLRRMIDTFMSFRKQLAVKLAALAKENQYPVDIHKENIMYDGERWILVDGFIIKSRDALANFIAPFQGVSQHYDQMMQVIQNTNHVLTASDYEKILDIQMLDPLPELQRLLDDQAASAG